MELRARQHQLAEGLFQALDKPGVSREFDVFQPNFIGYLADIRHGFVFEAVYDVPISGLVTMNPAYVFDIRAVDGLIDVTSVHQGVITPGNPLEPNLQQLITQALKDELPLAIEQAINGQLTVSLENPTLQFNCDPSLTEAGQQAQCATALLDDPNTPTIGDVFSAALQQAGLPAATADAIADQMAQGVSPKNFTCAPNSTGGNECAFHPIVKRINIMPDEIELVFAGEPEYSGFGEDDLVLLYIWLPIVNKGATGNPSPEIFCDLPIGRPDGVVTTTVHGAKG